MIDHHQRLLHRLAHVLGIKGRDDPTEEQVVKAVAHMAHRTAALGDCLDELKLRRPGQGPVFAAVQAARRLHALLHEQAREEAPVPAVAAVEEPESHEEPSTLPPMPPPATPRYCFGLGSAVYHVLKRGGSWTLCGQQTVAMATSVNPPEDLRLCARCARVLRQTGEREP